jgi:tRNA-guanine family transglycosylase
MLAATLLSIHNLYLLIELTREMRAAIREGRFERMVADWRGATGPGIESRAMA